MKNIATDSLYVVEVQAPRSPSPEPVLTVEDIRHGEGPITREIDVSTPKPLWHALRRRSAEDLGLQRKLL